MIFTYILTSLENICKVLKKKERAKIIIFSQVLLYKYFEEKKCAGHE